MSDNNYSSNSGIGLSSILTIIFVIAKLMGVITWSWWLVFLPTIISLSLLLLILGVVAVGIGIVAWFSK